jgi:hypothetical protein
MVKNLLTIMYVQGYDVENDEQKNAFYVFLVPESREELQEVQSLLQEISKDPGNITSDN